MKTVLCLTGLTLFLSTLVEGATFRHQTRRELKKPLTHPLRKTNPKTPSGKNIVKLRSGSRLWSSLAQVPLRSSSGPAQRSGPFLGNKSFQTLSVLIQDVIQDDIQDNRSTLKGTLGRVLQGVFKRGLGGGLQRGIQRGFQTGLKRASSGQERVGLV